MQVTREGRITGTNITVPAAAHTDANRRRRVHGCENLDQPGEASALMTAKYV
jgi:hypothetical protein